MQTTLTSAGGLMGGLLWQGGVLKHPKAVLPALAWRVTSQRRLGCLFVGAGHLCQACDIQGLPCNKLLDKFGSHQGK
eukprot:9921255-Prorocentrum_lima.AAC.1